MWRDLTQEEYDRAVCTMLRDSGVTPQAGVRIEALLSLISAILRRNGSTLIESRICCAEHLLVLVSTVSDPSLYPRIRLLFLLAWLELGAVVQRGPESVSRVPDLPSGVALPYGAESSKIVDPAVREEARKLAERHRETVVRWNAKQHALEQLNRLAALARPACLNFKDSEIAMKEMKMAMSLAPGLPITLRKLLEEDAQ